ncbi:MAG: hypothetical protein ACYCS7_05715, partial [Acidimicrobiales bacterium]
MGGQARATRTDRTNTPAPADVPGRISAPHVVSARLLGVLGLLAYNWWVLVPFKAGLLPSTDGFFGDLEANGRPYPTVMQHLDLLAGIILVIALVLRGPMGRQEDRGLASYRPGLSERPIGCVHRAGLLRHLYSDNPGRAFPARRAGSGGDGHTRLGAI